MSATTLPLIVEPKDLHTALSSTQNILLVDLSSPATYVQYHIPEAVFLDYNWIVHIEQPRMGLLPGEDQLSNVLSAIGLTEDTHVICYDDEGGGRACRFLWTLEVIGHRHYSLLNGGLQAWTKQALPVTSKISWPTPSNYHATIHHDAIADRQFIFDHLSDSNVVILDTRSAAEYHGEKVFAARGGHIPGAVNIEWTDAMDKQHDLRLKPENELRQLFASKGVTTDKTIITHCQTHHRSAHSFMVLKSLGYENIKGYPGSWSDWGNEANTPVEK